MSLQPIAQTTVAISPAAVPVPRRVSRRISAIEFQALEAGARINATAYVTHVALIHAGSLTAEEGRLAQSAPLCAHRYAAIVDALRGRGPGAGRGDGPVMSELFYIFVLSIALALVSGSFVGFLCGLESGKQPPASDPALLAELQALRASQQLSAMAWTARQQMHQAAPEEAASAAP